MDAGSESGAGTGRRGVWGPVWRLALAPALVYLAAFAALTWPLILRFGDLFYTDGGDGLQMVWNIWWTRHAVVDLHTHPWFTRLLHYPHGVTLLAHTLHPLKGFLSIPLFAVWDLVRVFNAAVVSSFVLGGVTMFWLAFNRCRAWWPSLAAGFIFTFSNYHFAHAQGHLQLVALEWIPLFLLAWLTWLERPGFGRAAAAAGALLLVILCDYYYFFFCVMAGGLMVVWRAWVRWRQAAGRPRTAEWLFVFRPPWRASLALFVVLAGATSGVLAGALARLSARDPLWGVHVAREFPLDPLALVIPGGHWRLAAWTRWFWTRLPGNEHEMSVHLGVAVLVLVILAAAWGRRWRGEGVSLWWWIAGCFGVLALGQRLSVWGHELSAVPLPYCLLERLVPAFRLSGVPVRFVVMVIVSAAMLAAFSLRALLRRPTRWRWVLPAGLCALLVIEYLPAPLPAHRLGIPAYVSRLRDTPGPGAVYDAVTPAPRQLYYQTVHGRPLAYGYVSREPLSVRRKDERILHLYRSELFESLRDRYGFRFFIVPPGKDLRPYLPEARLLEETRQLRLFDAGLPRGDR